MLTVPFDASFGVSYARRGASLTASIGRSGATTSGDAASEPVTISNATKRIAVDTAELRDRSTQQLCKHQLSQRNCCVTLAGDAEAHRPLLLCIHRLWEVERAANGTWWSGRRAGRSD